MDVSMTMSSGLGLDGLSVSVDLDGEQEIPLAKSSPSISSSQEWDKVTEPESDEPTV